MTKHHEQAPASPHLTLARRGWVSICHAWTGATTHRVPAPARAELVRTWEYAAAAFEAGRAWGTPASAQEEQDAVTGSPDGADLLSIGFDAGFEACEVLHAAALDPAPVPIPEEEE